MNPHYATIEETTFDGLRAWRITAASGATALVSALGATLLSWQPRPGVEVIDGYHDALELTGTVSARSRVMAPWNGRIRGGKYTFDGVEYQLDLDDAGQAMHGLVGDKEFSLISDNTALTLGYEFTGTPGYPWSFTVTASFSLENGADGAEHLSVQLAAKNTSESDIPLSLGWHPYVRLPGHKTIANCRVQIPARTKILVDTTMIPLAGEAAYSGVQAPVVYDYLGATQIDSSFRGLIPDNDGVVSTTVKDLSSNASIRITQEPTSAPVMHVFTADGLPRGARESIALEPSSHLPDAFNRADSQASVRLRPGAVRCVDATLTFVE